MTLGDVATSLPSFEQPPVVEAVLGVEFAPLRSFGAVNLCRLHERLRTVYPKTVEQFALGPEGPMFLLPTLESHQSPALRLWMISTDDSFLVQGQYDRIVVNWRKTIPESVYPRFPAIQNRFESAWSEFESVASDNDLGTVTPLIVDVSYVNRVELSDEITASTIFGLLSVNKSPKLDKISFNMSYSLDPSLCPLGGQVFVIAEKGASEEGEFVTFNVSARLAVGDRADDASLSSAITAAHSAAVTAFADNTTEQLHQLWGRRS